jgi:hypothetical protein
MTRLLALTLAAASIAAAQPGDGRDPVERAAALRGRFAQFHTAPVAVHAVSELAALVCAVNRSTGTGLYREALTRLKTLTPADFTSARRRLPEPSFTAFYEFVTEGARKCSPELEALFDAAGATAKMRQESAQAGETLRTAFSQVEEQPDRAAQLAEAAMSATDPRHLDVPLLTLLLSRLRGRAAEVADELFPSVLDFISTDRSPDPALLLEFGKHLFTAYRYVDQDDREQLSDLTQVGASYIADFSTNRRSTGADDVHDYIDAAVQVLSATSSPAYDPVAAYAVALQMEPKAGDFAPELSGLMRELAAQIATRAGGYAIQVRAALAGARAEQGLGEAARRRDRVVGRALAAARNGRFADARDLLAGVDDAALRAQTTALVDFREAGAAAARGELQWAFTLSRALIPGVKRALLYGALAAHAGSRAEALDYFQLALKDVDLLPPEQRMFTLSALAGAMLRIDSDNGYLALSLLATAANEAYANPRSGRFDPAIGRRIFSGNASSSTDSAFILTNRRHTCEVVDTGVGRRCFALEAPGLATGPLPALLRATRGGDADRMEAIALALRDESLLAASLNALASQRMEAGRKQPRGRQPGER